MATLTAVMTPEDLEAQELLAKWEQENEFDSDNDDNEEEKPDEPTDMEEFLEQYRHEVTVTDHALDHVVLGTSDLAKAVQSFKKLTGIEPVATTSLKGTGTKSVRVAFEGCAYLEIVGPDPSQSSTSLSRQLESLDESDKLVPLHYAVRSFDVQAQKQKVLAAASPNTNVTIDQITMIDKDRHMPWFWELCIFEGHTLGGLVPHLVQWPKDGHHPSAKLPIVGTLKDVRVQAPVSFTSFLPTLLNQMDAVEFETSSEPLLEFSFTSPTGTHSFSCSDPIGISFPK